MIAVVRGWNNEQAAARSGRASSRGHRHRRRHFCGIVRRRGGSCADPGKCFSVCQRDAWLAGTVTNPDAVHFISESTPASSSAPTPSPPTIPDGWVLHSQQPSERGPAFSFAYPSNWFPYSTSNDVPGDGLSVSVYSFNRVERGQPSNYPPESMKVDINVANAQRVGACGPSGGEPTSLGGFPARQVVTYYDPPHPSGVVLTCSPKTEPL